MLNIDLKNKIDSPTAVSYTCGNVPVNNLSDIGDAVAAITAALNRANVTKVSEMLPIIKYRDVNYTDEYAAIRTLEMIINIANDGPTATDFSYMVKMLDDARASYDSVDTRSKLKSAMLTTIEFPEVKNDLPIDELILALIEALTYDGAMTVLDIVIPYDILD